MDCYASWLLSSILLLYILLLCSCRVDYCFAKDTLKQGEWITGDEKTTLVSSGGTFEMGFFNSSNHKRFVGIWYKWDRPTYVWVANRDNPVISVSMDVYFGIAEDGNLKVRDIAGKVYWSTSVENSSSTIRSVKLMDSGNLVLRDNQLATSQWESFQNPTDTFLPGMKMDEQLTLTSWIGDGDPGKGNFTFKQDQGEGRYVISKKPIVYWRNWILNEMPDTIAKLLSNVTRFNSTASCKRYPKLPYYAKCIAQQYKNSNDSCARLVMNYTGELQCYQSGDLTWREPKNECSIYNACGNSGSCNVNNKLVCKCLPGFQPANQESWNSRDFLEGCTKNWKSYDKSYKFLSLKMMKVSNSDTDVEAKNETECRKECLDNSQCKAYSYAPNSSQRGTNKCWIWTSELSNLQEEYTKGGRDLYVRVAKSAIESTVRDCEPCGTNLIPYPLSTGPSCGDAMYFSFYCNNSTGQVNFKTHSGTYRVTGIDPRTRTFVIQVKHAEHLDARNSLGNLDGPFNMTDQNFFNSSEDEVHLNWETPQPPTCTFPQDCKDWPNSICTKAKDVKRCLCTRKFKWNGSNLSCTKDGNSPRPSKEASKEKISLILIVMIPLIILLLVLANAFVCIYLWRRKMAKRQENRRSDQRNRVLCTLDTERHLKDLIDSGQFKEEDEKGIDVPFFDLESILAATDNFSDANKVGEGGYGPVYKGTFPGGQEFAVKRLSNVSGQGFQEFKNEVVLISKLQHRNLVRLRGYCVKGYEKLLLYEYMPNKSLDSFLFDHKLSMSLNWEMRFKIILGMARGLVYLHHDSRLRIIHRDLKTSNILLDEEINAKISDFGIARIIEGKEIGANTTRLAGTYGYMSPEYALNGLFSIKSDVFSFGVVLLEIISGKKNYESEVAMSLIGYAWRLWVENKVLDLMDQALHEVCNVDQFVKCVNIGLLCVQEEPNDRPTMSTVVTMLDSETTTMQTPKRPAFVLGTGFSSTASSSTRPNTYSESTSSLGGT